MKKKTKPEIPDSIFKVLGIYMPKASQTEDDYEKGRSVTDYLQAERILTLKKESRYQKTFPKLEHVELLKLNLKAMPSERGPKVGYLLKAIRKKIQQVINAAETSKDEEPINELFRALTKDYEGDISIEPVSRFSNSGSVIASAVFERETFYMVKLPKLSDERMYGTLKGKRSRKDGYYRFRSMPNTSAHIISLIDLLTYLALFQGLHNLKQEIDLPLVQNYFEAYALAAISAGSNTDGRKKAAEAITRGRPIPLDVLIQYHSSEQKPQFHIAACISFLYSLTELFCKIYDLCRDISSEIRDRAESAKHIATAYITKKNIPLGVRHAMEKTAFINYFKYVEFDEDVDLSSVQEIEKEFLVLNRAYFGSHKYPAVTLRFRKLGKHKVTVLYYPGLDTLCVDIRSPASFIHEFFHMIDDQLGDLSLSIEFEPLVDEYKQAFEKSYEKLDGATKERLSGNTKYNKSYFFRRAEIFARCGEIYFVRILKVESSLIQPDLAYAYPPSEELDSLIKAFYDKLLEKKLEESALPIAG